jgi:hypothetical protein
MGFGSADGKKWSVKPEQGVKTRFRPQHTGFDFNTPVFAFLAGESRGEPGEPGAV